MSKKCVAVIFGGQSSEHIVSCMSAVMIIKNIDREKYDILIVGITEEGHWIKVDNLEQVEKGTWRENRISAVLSADATHHGFLIEHQDGMQIKQVDVVFPILHGKNGEDGTIQGLLELANIPYVGCGVLASSVSMDKWFTKIVVDTLGIRQAKYVPVLAKEANKEETLAKVEAHLPYPVFVKPSCAGSSKGVSKAGDRTELAKALKEAALHDRKILVEEAIIGREIECAILGGEHAKASGVGEILAAAEFYDFEAKYFNQESKTVLDPDIPKETVDEIRNAAAAIFKAVDGHGLSRVDFFVEDKTNEVVFNEINTIPGFTHISMYPMLWDHQGISNTDLVSQLIELAFVR